MCVRIYKINIYMHVYVDLGCVFFESECICIWIHNTRTLSIIEREREIKSKFEIVLCVLNFFDIKCGVIEVISYFITCWQKQALNITIIQELWLSSSSASSHDISLFAYHVKWNNRFYLVGGSLTNVRDKQKC